jgi:hypothetical protein
VTESESDEDSATSYTPLYEAQHSERYARRELIKRYEAQFECQLVVMIDRIFSSSVTLFEELIFDASPKCNLHLMLWSPGGDGETAIRLARAAQSRCKELTVIIPDQAKSAATLLAMAAHNILMGPASDLGPVDPQFQMADGSLVSAKHIIAAVDEAAANIQQAPATFPLYASLLSDVNALKVQEARSAIARTDQIVTEVLRSNPNRSNEQVEEMAQKVSEQLVAGVHSHGAFFGLHDAVSLGLPIQEANPKSPQWRLIWQLWTRYAVMMPIRVYESATASQVFPWLQPGREAERE